MTALALIVLASLAGPLPPQSAAPDADAEFLDLLSPLEGTRPVQWRVVWTTDPATTATVSWTTAAPGTTHRVLFDTTPRATADEEYAHEAASHRDGEYTRREDDETTAYYHHVRLAELEPATTYWFTIESDGIRSRELHFTTAPADDRPVSILVGGDSRTGWHARCVVNRSVARYVAEHPEILAFSHGGDFVMWGDHWDEWSKWLSHHELMTTRDGRVLPILPTRGNHDFGAPFDEVFDDPGTAARNYYRTRLSSAASLFTLNTNISAAGDQYTWLETELEAAFADSKWLVTNYHRALYPAVKTPGEAKPFWVPLFEMYGVDLSLESDGHTIKRTVPIIEDEPHPEGVVYVGEGGLGVPQRTPLTDPWYLQPPGMVTNGHHVLRLDFGTEALRVRFLRLPALPDPLAAEHFVVAIPPGADWSYLAAGSAPADWAAPAFDATAWPVGPAGFGFGDDDDATVLEDMRGAYDRVHLRRAFDAAALEGSETLSLMCRYDDAFVAYLNGIEVARAGVDGPVVGEGTSRVQTHEARGTEVFPIPGWRELVREEGNVLALVGLNRMTSDRDFTLDPWLAGDRREDPLRAGVVFEVIDDTERPLRPRD